MDYKLNDLLRLKLMSMPADKIAELCSKGSICLTDLIGNFNNNPVPDRNVHDDSYGLYSDQTDVLLDQARHEAILTKRTRDYCKTLKRWGLCSVHGAQKPRYKTLWDSDSIRKSRIMTAHEEYDSELPEAEFSYSH
jgi:hypothetical protein